MSAANPRREARLRSTLEGLRAEAAAARPRLRRLLLAGADTSAARAEADACAARIVEIIAELSGIEADQTVAGREAIADNAARITAGTIAAIDARLDALKPPAKPSFSLENRA
jgi:hypothetical protein